MLPKNRRIQRSLYPKERPKEVFRVGELSLFVFDSNTRDTKALFSISKKIAKSAVVRNKWRRAGYRKLSQILPSIKDKYLLRFSIGAVPKGLEIFKKNIEEVLKKSSVLQS